ncbi:MAG: TIGR03032 family protein [Methylovulum sp.]|nr:TIGR03032 family protein [Methylovulum sp.]
MTEQQKLSITPSAGFRTWLCESEISLAFTTYQTNRLCLVGLKSDGGLAVNERLFDKPMGLFTHGNRLCLTTRYQIWEFENRLSPGEIFQGSDCLYMPSRSHITGNLNAHDIVLDSDQRVLFINTGFSCLAELRPGYSFAPVWQPPFISQLVPEDRCHLNGLALKDGKPAYATACSRTDRVGGWRDCQLDGGIVMDIASNEIIATGLSMPHSPRWYRGKLWLLNSGTGELGNLDGERFSAVTACLGFVRGLAFYGDYAVVGLSKLRSNSFTDATLEAKLKAQGKTSQCGLAVVNLMSGTVEHGFYFDNLIEELYDVAVLPKVRQPKALGLQNDDIQRIVTFPESSGLMVTSPSIKPQGLNQTLLSAALPEIPDLNEAVRYQRVYHLTPENLLAYDAMTYPSLQTRWQTQPPRGELLGVSASVDGELVGLAVAEGFIDSAEPCSELLSLYVVPAYRHQDIETKLTQYLQDFAAQQLDCTTVTPNI